MRIIVFSLFAAVMLMSCGDNGSRPDAFGNFEAVETLVSAETGGKVIMMDFQTGDQISAGDLIAVIDTSRLSLEIRQAEARKQAVAAGRINLRAQAEVEKERMRTLDITRKRLYNLFEDNAATQQQIDDVEGQMRLFERQLKSLETQNVTIDSEIAVIEAQIELLRNDMLKSNITSPISGRVLEKYVEPGEVVLPGKSIVKLADLANLDLKVFVSGAQLPLINLGQQVEVLTDGVASLTGVVTWISSEAEFTPKIIQTREERVKLVYAVKVSVKNDGSLKIGMPGEIIIR